jgi:hypothetical protein
VAPAAWGGRQGVGDQIVIVATAWPTRQRSPGPGLALCITGRDFCWMIVRSAPPRPAPGKKSGVAARRRLVEVARLDHLVQFG